MRSKIRIRKFANALIEGKNQKEAAISVGVPEASAHTRGSELAKNPEVQSIIAESMRQYCLGPDRYCKEVDKGLKKSKVDGKHIEYVDRLGSLNGIAAKGQEEKAPHTQILINLIDAIESAKKDGIIDS